jgi:hypothetical protein
VTSSDKVLAKIGAPKLVSVVTSSDPLKITLPAIASMHQAAGSD